MQRGRIFYGPDHSLSFDCMIRNMTELGAMVRISPTQAMPETFILLHVLGGMAFESHLVWRLGADAGVSFAAQYDLHGEVDLRLKGVRRVWLALAPS